MNNLRYVDAVEPGFTRRRNGKGWRYFNSNGRPVRSPSIVARLDALALPPAYKNAWYARDSRAHIQATGIDARGRKQYRYHADFRAKQEEVKYEKCAAFGKSLPNIRKQVEADLRRKDLSKERVVAAVVRLLDLGRVRVGNASYARDNRSYGATTLRNRHAKVISDRVVLDYIGKSGKQHRIGIADRRLVTLVKKCQDLPGQTLFQYVDSEGNPRPVTSDDVNAYIRSRAGEEFTAKNFRTWGASVIAFGVLANAREKIPLKLVLADVAAKLGNTPAIARKSYVHPAVIRTVLDPPENGWKLPRKTRFLSREERGFLEFLGRAKTVDDPAY